MRLGSVHFIAKRCAAIYGTYTRSAVSRFQKAQGWTGHGNVGPKTWARLF